MSIQPALGAESSLGIQASSNDVSAGICSTLKFVSLNSFVWFFQATNICKKAAQILRNQLKILRKQLKNYKKAAQKL